MKDTEALLAEATLDDLPETMQEFAKNAGMAVTLDFLRCNGGLYLYIPKLDVIERKVRDRAIQREFNGDNLNELARKYNVTAITARRIIYGKSGQSK